MLALRRGLSVAGPRMGRLALASSSAAFHSRPAPVLRPAARPALTLQKRNRTIMDNLPPPKERLTKAQVEEKAIAALKKFDRFPKDKLDQVTLDSHIINDLGLDSLDHVEIIMEMEDEFQIEIPDGDAERLMTPRLIVQYVCDHDEIYE